MTELTSSEAGQDIRPTAEQAGQPRARGWKALAVGLALVVFVGALANFTGTRGDLRALEKMGVPLDGEADFKLMPKDGDNAASIYLEAEEGMFEIRRESGNFGFGAEEFYPAWPDRPYGSRPIERAKEAATFIEKFRVGAAMSRCVFDPLPEDDVDALPRFQVQESLYHDVRSPVGMLCGAANAEVEEGKVSEALKDLALARNVNVQLSKNAGTDAYMAWFEQSRILYRNLYGCIYSHRDDRHLMEGIAKMLEEPPPMASLRLAVAGDFPETMRMFMAAQKDPFEYKVKTRSRSDEDITDNSMLMRYAVNQAIHQWRATFESLPEDPTDWKGFRDAFVKASEDLYEKWPAKEVLADQFLGYSRLCVSWAAIQARHRLAYVASKLCAMRIDNGTAPNALPDFGENAIDPFTGRPFNYKRLGKGFHLYSIGPDGIDNVANPPTKSSINDDIIYDFEE